MSAPNPPRNASIANRATDDRALIATALDETLIVEAAAGTGKTTELVARIVRLIQTGKAVDHPVIRPSVNAMAETYRIASERPDLATARSEIRC